MLFFLKKSINLILEFPTKLKIMSNYPENSFFIGKTMHLKKIKSSLYFVKSNMN